MRSPLVKIAGLTAVVLLAGAATSSRDAHATRANSPILDSIPAVRLAGADLRAEADDSGRVVAELRVGERVVRGTFEPSAVLAWTDAADSVIAGKATAGVPTLEASNGSRFEIATTTEANHRELALRAASEDSLVMLHADVTHRSAPAIGTLRHAAKVANAIRFVTRR